MCYLRELRKYVGHHGSKNIIYFDESGFVSESYLPHGWVRRGVKVHGDIRGNNRKSINLIMAQRGKEWLAPMLFKGSCSKEVVQTWLERELLPALTQSSLIRTNQDLI